MTFFFMNFSSFVETEIELVYQKLCHDNLHFWLEFNLILVATLLLLFIWDSTATLWNCVATENSALANFLLFLLELSHFHLKPTKQEVGEYFIIQHKNES